jgi:hypothetical protein
MICKRFLSLATLVSNLGVGVGGGGSGAANCSHISSAGAHVLSSLSRMRIRANSMWKEATATLGFGSIQWRGKNISCPWRIWAEVEAFHRSQPGTLVLYSIHLQFHVSAHNWVWKLCQMLHFFNHACLGGCDLWCRSSKGSYWIRAVEWREQRRNLPYWRKQRKR